MLLSSFYKPSHGKQNGPGGSRVRSGSCVDGHDVPENMDVMLALACNKAPQAQRFWFIAVALENMNDMSFTLDTFQEERSWLKAMASRNMDLIVPA